jgi:hypothetical protein
VELSDMRRAVIALVLLSVGALAGWFLSSISTGPKRGATATLTLIQPENSTPPDPQALISLLMSDHVMKTAAQTLATSHPAAKVGRSEQEFLERLSLDLSIRREPSDPSDGGRPLLVLHFAERDTAAATEVIRHVLRAMSDHMIAVFDGAGDEKRLLLKSAIDNNRMIRDANIEERRKALLGMREINGKDLADIRLELRGTEDLRTPASIRRGRRRHLRKWGSRWRRPVLASTLRKSSTLLSGPNWARATTAPGLPPARSRC